MPVILHARDYDPWLNREATERLPLDLFRPFDSEAMEMYEANPKVILKLHRSGLPAKCTK